MQLNFFAANDQPPKFDKREYTQLIQSLKKRGSFYAVFSVDLTNIRSLTAEKLAILIFCKRYAQENGVRFVLKGVSPCLKAFFELTRMQSFFSIVQSSVP